MLIDIGNAGDGVVRLECYRKNPADEKRGYLPSYEFHITLPDGRVAGICDLRVGQNINTFFGGNIGYTVLKDYRGNGYAERALRLLLPIAKRLGMRYVLVTTTPDNAASRHIIEKCGGFFIDRRDIPKNHEMYGAGRTETVRYKIVL